MKRTQSGLAKGLSLITMFTLMTGAMVGMAWAVLANVFMDRAGPAGVISFVIAAILCIFIGLCYAELCAAMPKAGVSTFMLNEVWGVSPGLSPVGSWCWLTPP